MFTNARFYGFASINALSRDFGCKDTYYSVKRFMLNYYGL